MTENTVFAYCMHCKAKRKIIQPQVYQFKQNKRNGAMGMSAVKGYCEVCNTSMFKILPKKR